MIRHVSMWANWSRSILTPPGQKSLSHRVSVVLHYGIAVLTVVSATGVMRAIDPDLGLLNVGLIFLLATFTLALTLGSGPAVLAAVLSFLAFNFFFIPPFHTFAIARSDYILALFVYLAIAIVTGQLVARVRMRTESAIQEQRRTALLYELNAVLIGNITLDAILTTIVERVVHIYRASECRILLPEDDTLRVRARYPSTALTEIDRQRLAMATWVMEHHSLARQGGGRSRLRLPHGTQNPLSIAQPRHKRDVLYLPIATSERTVGVLEIAGKPGGGAFDDDDIQLLTSFSNQAALALERARLTEEAGRAAILAESDAFKSALLATVSHELRTPLAAIKASATSLLDESVDWQQDARAEFLHAIDEETDRLTLMVGNLLDLSRIEGGALTPDKEWYDLAELIADVDHRLATLTDHHRLIMEIEPNLPLVCFDYVEIAQVLTNLVENAVKYTPAGTAITISACEVPGAVEIMVRDAGPGIPPDRLPRIFDKFYRADPAARSRGSGIGLTISKGLVEAHGGRIIVESRENQGTTFRFCLPLNESGAETP